MIDDDAWAPRGGPLRRLLARRLRGRLGIPDEAQAGVDDEDGRLDVPHGFGGGAAFEPPPGIERLGDLAYGAHPRQRLDVYRRLDRVPDSPGAPVLVVVHGGGWARGDKRHAPSIAARVDHWGAAGWIVVAVNYRFVPDATPREQAVDVAQALTCVRRTAPTWGGDAQRLVLIGHSAGAHLCALLSADAALRSAAGLAPWSATVALDGAALDVERLMRRPHLPLFDAAFGAEPTRWRAASPTLVLDDAPPPMPMLMVCSARRPMSCAQAEAFARRANALSGRVQVLAVDLGHAQINALAGAPGPLTTAIDGFVADALGLQRAA